MVESTRRNVALIGCAIAAVFLLALSSITGGFLMQFQMASAQIDNAPTAVKFYPNPTLTNEQQNAIIDAAMNVPGVKSWSLTGWQYASMDFVGVTQPQLQWQTAVVYLKLPVGAGNPPVACEQGWWATIDVDLQTFAVKEAGYPTMENNECHSNIVLGDPGAQKTEESYPWFVQTASAIPTTPGFLLMEDNDVTSNNIFGTLAYFKTPAYSTNIYSHMDNYIAELINWKSSTSKLVQQGWLITHIAGCTTCGSETIAANSGDVIYADQSVFGNLEAHKVPGSGFAWVNGREELGETICSGGSNYIVAIGYGVGNIFNHNTNVSCSTSDNGNVVSNAGYFENWNTVASSNWSGDITDPVTMYSAYEGRGSTSNWLTWLSSTNQKEDCHMAYSSTTALSGSLASGGTVTITPSGVPIACYSSMRELVPNSTFFFLLFVQFL